MGGRVLSDLWIRSGFRNQTIIAGHRTTIFTVPLSHVSVMLSIHSVNPNPNVPTPSPHYTILPPHQLTLQVVVVSAEGADGVVCQAASALPGGRTWRLPVMAPVVGAGGREGREGREGRHRSDAGPGIEGARESGVVVLSDLLEGLRIWG